MIQSKITRDVFYHLRSLSSASQFVDASRLSLGDLSPTNVSGNLAQAATVPYGLGFHGRKSAGDSAESWVMLDLDSKNAHTFCSRERLEEELKMNAAYHNMLESFRALYGKTVTIQ